MLRLYQRTMNGPRRGERATAELRAGDLMVLVPLLLAMLFIALWPKGWWAPPPRAIERAIVPAQVAADRPADQIRAVVAANPPAYAEPLPGDPGADEAAAAVRGGGAVTGP